MKAMILGVLALVCAAASGCGSPSCSDAVTHIMDLRAKDNPDLTAEKKAERIAKMTKKCEDKKPSAAVLKCITAAKDRDALEKCNPEEK